MILDKIFNNIPLSWPKQSPIEQFANVIRSTYQHMLLHQNDIQWQVIPAQYFRFNTCIFKLKTVWSVVLFFFQSWGRGRVGGGYISLLRIPNCIWFVYIDGLYIFVINYSDKIWHTVDVAWVIAKTSSCTTKKIKEKTTQNIAPL